MQQGETMHVTYADLLRPAKRTSAWIYDLTCVVGFSFILALSAQIAIRLPFSPVPVTGQTFVVLLMGVLLGRKRAVATVILYLAEGAAGLPVFAGGGAGLAFLLGPTGGYLFGFIITAGLIGVLSERGWDRKIAGAAAAMILGNTVLYLFGLPWLAMYVGFDNVFFMGFYPFIPGDLIKIAVASFMLPLGWKVIGKIRR
jgi:biotin transport system substrate-specific component